MKFKILLTVFLILALFDLTFGQDLLHKNSPINISDGNKYKWSGDLKFGRNPDVDTGTDPEDIWNTGGTFTPFPDDSTCEIVSASGDDAAAGTGARTATVYGVDSSFARISETVTLNGATEVDLTNSYRVVHRVVVATAGSGLTNAGAITVQTKTNDVAMLTLGADNGQSETAVFAIAADETAFLRCWGISTLTAAADVAAKLFVFNVTGNVWNLKDNLHSRATGTTAPHRNRDDFPGVIDGPAIIKITVTTDTDDSDVTGHYIVLYKKD